ncbi:MAG: hypothetical protein Q4D98_03555 [Planctomycetia bacterium]|nr:hypothetical protein [Planctomycetia bacterium]
MLGQLGWSWSDIEPLTWRELNAAWEAKFEMEADTLAFQRYELQKLYSAIFAAAGVRVPLPDLQDLNPLKVV